jgi:ABC-2 type transport system permease protein
MRWLSNILSAIFRFFVRTFAFLRKEIYEVLRQPRLVLTLVIGPFLILLLVGIGYRNQARPLRTLFVAPPGSEMEAQIQQYAQSFGPSLIFEGMTGDTQEAMNRLRRGEVDLVAVAPTDAVEKIRHNEQATFMLYHNEIDPLQVSYVEYFGQIYVNEVNRVVLQKVAEQGQSEASTVQDAVKAMRDNARQAREALERSDVATAQTQQRQLGRNLSIVELALGSTLGVLSSVEQTSSGKQSMITNEVRSLLSDLRKDTDALAKIQESGDHAQDIERLRSIETRLDTLDKNLATFQQISPYFLVRPFASRTQGISTIQPRLTDYFAPAVIVLLLQHLAITFAALSMVRDRQLGTIELFRVSPLGAFETLVGKYISYLLFGGVLAALLTALMYFALGVPMLGNWWNFVMVIAALLFTSLGLGFLISLLSRTDSQAVQYAMIVLLTSVFFSGMFLSLQAFWEPVRLVSWLLPASYATSLLQNIMLRGLLPNLILLGGLALFGLILFIINLLVLRRSMARS